MTAPHFRAGVVVVVRRADGQVLAFERGDVAGQWQLPQGGIDEGETPEQAAWRELGEETGLGADEVRLVGEHPRWTVYELPDDVRRRMRPGRRLDRRLGQAHRWFFFEMVDDAVEPVPDGREFVAWRWTTVDDLIAGAAPFRLDGYTEVLGERSTAGGSAT